MYAGLLLLNFYPIFEWQGQNVRWCFNIKVCHGVKFFRCRCSQCQVFLANHLPTVPKLTQKFIFRYVMVGANRASAATNIKKMDARNKERKI